MGSGIARRLDPLLVAEGPQGAAALAHMRHVAIGFGYHIDRIASSTAAVYRFRDAGLIDRRRLVDAVDVWLAGAAVKRLPALGTGLTIKRDGTVRIEAESGALEAAIAILADDRAILRLLGTRRLEWMRSAPASSVLIEPRRPADAPVIVSADSSAAIVSLKAGGIMGISPGSAAEALTHVGNLLPGPGGRRAGQVDLATVATRDGGPVIGQLKSPKAWVVAGLGLTGAFLAPALARFIAGAANPREAAFFEARVPGPARAAVAEFAPAPPLGAVA
jgi:hypothetical protein